MNRLNCQPQEDHRQISKLDFISTHHTLSYFLRIFPERCGRSLRSDPGLLPSLGIRSQPGKPSQCLNLARGWSAGSARTVCPSSESLNDITYFWSVNLLFTPIRY